MCREQNFAAATANGCRGANKRNLECLVIVVDDEVEGMARENALNCTTGDDQAIDINAMASELVENSDVGMLRALQSRPI
jgi:hypothetical protein